LPSKSSDESKPVIMKYDYQEDLTVLRATFLLVLTANDIYGYHGNSYRSVEYLHKYNITRDNCSL